MYLIIVHDDLSQNAIQPAELADYLKKYCPIEYAVSLGFAYLTLESSGVFWINFLTLPLFIFNVTRFLAKDHKQYFFTKTEYKKNSGRMEFQY